MITSSTARTGVTVRDIISQLRALSVNALQFSGRGKLWNFIDVDFNFGGRAGVILNTEYQYFQISNSNTGLMRIF